MLFFSKQKETTVIDFRPFFAINDAIKFECRGKYYASRVEDMKADSIIVAWPSSLGSNVKLRDQETVVLISSVRVGMNGFRGTIRRASEGPPALVEVVVKEGLGKVQRRDYARVPETLPLQFRVLDPKSPNAGAFVKTTTRNLSGGGLLVNVDRKTRPLAGDDLEIQLDLPGCDPIRARTKVVRVDAPAQSDCDRYEMAIRFTQILEQDRKAIIKQVFAREAELRRVGLL